MKKVLILIILIISAFLVAYYINAANTNLSDIDFQNGDIIFQSSQSRQSKALELVTKSQYTHVGMIYKIKDQIYVYEAVQPVKLTKLDKWISRGKNEHFVLKRLKDRSTLTASNLNLMKKIGKKFLNKNYDIYFKWSDKRMYCSELIWKLYKRVLNIEIGKLQKMSDFDVSSKEAQKIIKKRYGVNFPQNETVITPKAMFDSKLLYTVYEN